MLLTRADVDRVHIDHSIEFCISSKKMFSTRCRCNMEPSDKNLLRVTCLYMCWLVTMKTVCQYIYTPYSYGWHVSVSPTCAIMRGCILNCLFSWHVHVHVGVRLVGGPQNNIGVLQILQGVEWREVADQDFYEASAEVACR